MSLTPEQKSTVAGWVTAGDNLSAVQKKLLEQFNITMTYMDVRFLVDDLELTLKDPAPKADTSDVSKGAPASAAPAAAAPAAADDAEVVDELEPEATGGGNVSVTIDHAVLNPNAIASGDVTFSDGVTGKWIVDTSGRPGFTQISQPGYRPSPADAQAFMQELSRALQARGL
ncbi:MAG: hypothetical protein K9M98_06115 [Cephaloticoccus sp.]|nr:hypothetical protein [Cephaloticoccus sp.]MCF7760060.1 hypothetical protein [Cephaloticoccus sp.]